jgi:hypothetical protein
VIELTNAIHDDTPTAALPQRDTSWRPERKPSTAPDSESVAPSAGVEDPR